MPDAEDSSSTMLTQVLVDSDPDDASRKGGETASAGAGPESAGGGGRQPPSAAPPPKRRSAAADRLRAWAGSPHVQAALQLAVGMLVCCLFTYVQPLSFPPSSCVVPTLFLVISVMSSPDNHLGTRVVAAAGLVGSLWVGCAGGATVTTVASLIGGHTPHSPAAFATGVLLGSLLLALLSVNRVATTPPTLWAAGANSCLGLGLVAANTWRQPTIALVWRQAGLTALASVVAAGISIGVAALVVPTLASEEAQEAVADVMLQAGVCTSRYAARLFRPGGQRGGRGSGGGPQGADGHKGGPPGAAADGGRGSAGAAPPAAGAPAAAAGKAAPAASPFAAAASEPGGGGGGGGGGWPGGAERLEQYGSLGELGAALVLPDTLSDEQWLKLIDANTSPDPPPAPGAYACPMRTPRVDDLRPRLAQAGMLLASAAVEPPCFRGGPGCCCCRGGGAAWFSVPLWHEVVAAVAVLVTRLSALEAVMEDGVSYHEGDESLALTSCQLTELRLVFSRAAASLSLMAGAVRRFGRGGGQEKAQAQAQASGPLCSRVGELRQSWADARAALVAVMEERAEQRLSALLAAAPGSPMVLPDVDKARSLMFLHCLVSGTIDAMDALERRVAAALCAPAPPPSPLRWLGWAAPLVPMLNGRHMAANVWRALSCTLLGALREGGAGVGALLCSRSFQAGAKYWLVLTLALAATLAAVAFDPELASLSPAFGYVAASLAMSERAEATLTKFVFWAGGTLAGGALGWLLMARPATAGSPAALTAVAVAAALLVGLAVPTRLRVAVTLSLMTLTALVLCQCCGHLGRPEVVLTRVLSVLGGVTLAVAVCNLVLPVYTSTWALEAMADAYGSALQLFSRLYAKSYRDGADAVAAFSISCAAPAGGGAGAAAGGAEAARCARAVYSERDVRQAAATAAQLEAAAEASFPADVVTAAVQQAAAAAATGAAGAAAAGVAVGVESAAVLQLLVARPLVQVQASLQRDTVAWRRGVLATPPVVPKLLSALLQVLDRLAALQLALVPPRTAVGLTGIHALLYGPVLRDHIEHLVELLGLLSAAVSALLAQPHAKAQANAVRVLLRSICRQRLALYRAMADTRQRLHLEVLRQQEQLAAVAAAAAPAGGAGGAAPAGFEQRLCRQLAAERGPAGAHLLMAMGGVDDAVAFLATQCAVIKLLDRASAVARVALLDVCRSRNSVRSTLT